MRDKLIQWLGGYTEEEVLTTAVKHLYNTIGPEDILKENREGKWTMNGKILDDGTKNLIIEEAKMMVKMKTWKILQNDIKYRANKKMFEKSQTEMDLVAGKLWLYTLDNINTRLESLAQGRGIFNVDA